MDILGRLVVGEMVRVRSAKAKRMSEVEGEALVDRAV
jgi:hypothetical protein